MNIPFGDHMLVAVPNTHNDGARHFRLKGTGHKFSIEVVPEGWLVRSDRTPDGLLFIDMDWHDALIRQVREELQAQSQQDQDQMRELARQMQAAEEAQQSAWKALERITISQWRNMLLPVEQIWNSIPGHCLLIAQDQGGVTCTHFQTQHTTFHKVARKPKSAFLADDMECLIQALSECCAFDEAWGAFRKTNRCFLQTLLPGVNYDLTVGEGEVPSEVRFHALDRSVRVGFCEPSQVFTLTCYDYSTHATPVIEEVEGREGLPLKIRSFLFGA